MTLRTLKTPVLLLAFNRPELTNRVFDKIREVKPEKLYVAVDAPRENRKEDVENSLAVKKIVENVDWPCETHYLYQEKNLGCSRSGVTAWNWIFQHEDRMIFVEDDGLGCPEAFFFIEEMLERYKDDERVAYVGSVNYGPKYGDASYFFSRYPDSTYLMGTWKRVFKKYEYDMESYPKIKKTKIFKASFHSRSEWIVLNQSFRGYIESVKKGRRLNSYDIQMLYLSYRYNMVSIYPNSNLCSNIGFLGGANCMLDENSDFYKEYANRKIEPFTEINYCDEVEVNLEFEKFFFKKRILLLKPWYKVVAKSLFLEYFGGVYKKWIKPIRYSLRRGYTKR